MSTYSKMTAEEKRAYSAMRNARIVSFNLGEPDVKKRLRAAAKAEGRTINNWIGRYVLPVLLETLDRQAARNKAAKKG